MTKVGPYHFFLTKFPDIKQHSIYVDPATKYKTSRYFPFDVSEASSFGPDSYKFYDQDQKPPVHGEQ